MLSITLTIGAVTCAKFVAEYLGLIESTTANTRLLRHESLRSAIAWFENARDCNDSSLMIEYLHDARREFMKAISLEENENKVAAILGLSTCQCLLGDAINSQNNIQKIKEVKLSFSEKSIIVAMHIAADIFSPVVMMIAMITKPSIRDHIRQREQELEEYKKDALQFNTKLLTLQLNK